MRSLLLLLLAAALLGAAPEAAAATDCLSIRRVVAFAPRGQVYVDVDAACREQDFGGEDSLVAHVEVLVGALPPASAEVRVYRDSPRRGRTLVFEDLALEPQEVLLVRLVRFGRILDLTQLEVP